METYESEGREELTSLLDVARAISPKSQEIASRSRTSPEDTEELALMRLLDDNGRGSKTLLEILKDTPTGEAAKKYLGLTENQQEDDLIFDRSRKNPELPRRIIVLSKSNDENGYKIVRLQKEYEQPWEVDVLNTEADDSLIQVDEATARKLDEHINDQRTTYEANLTELVKTTF